MMVNSIEVSVGNYSIAILNFVWNTY